MAIPSFAIFPIIPNTEIIASSKHKLHLQMVSFDERTG
jgi:hypothetical protein